MERWQTELIVMMAVQCLALSVKHYKRLPVRPIKFSYRQDERIILGQSQPHPTALTAAWKQPDPDPTNVQIQGGNQ